MCIKFYVSGSLPSQCDCQECVYWLTDAYHKHDLHHLIFNWLNEPPPAAKRIFGSPFKLLCDDVPHTFA